MNTVCSLFFTALLFSFSSSQQCQGITAHDQCVSTRGCGWCGANNSLGFCAQALPDGSGPATGKCRLYWDNSQNCMTKGFGDSDNCYRAGCGWCGTTWQYGVCVPKSRDGQSPLGAQKCSSGFWDNANCLYRGRSDSDDCFRAGACGWCGTSFNVGVCLPFNGTKNGPIGSNCSSYWDASNCLYRGRADSDDCTKIGNCGWCGNSLNSGVCLPVNSTRTGPLTGNCSAYWDASNCMYPGRADSDDCFKLGKCGWCGTSANSGVCLPKDSRGNITGNVCNYSWDNNNCLYRGANDPSKCNLIPGCQYCIDTNLCLPTCPIDCSTPDYYQCARQKGCGWCTSWSYGNRRPGPLEGICVDGTVATPSSACNMNDYCPDPRGPYSCMVWDAANCSAVTDSVTCEVRHPCRWCVINSYEFCIADIPANHEVADYCQDKKK